MQVQWLLMIAIGQLKVLYLLIVMAHFLQILIRIVIMRATPASSNGPQTRHYFVVTCTTGRGLKIGN